MPELPEVETMRRGIAAVVGSRIERVEVLRTAHKAIPITPSPDRVRRGARGRAIEATDRLGKRVVLRLSGARALIFEPRMTGLVLLADPPSEEHLRVRLHLSGPGPRRLLFWDRRGLGGVQLLTNEELRERINSGRLGPDALEVSPDEIRRRLSLSRREIKVALLDQQRIAGIGNLYASEMLHVAGISPLKRCDRMTTRQWQRLHAAMVQVLTEAIRCEGSTLADGTYRNALSQNGSYQNHHRVYARGGQLCPTCEEQVIQRIVQAQRSTFFCRGCQRKGDRR